MRHSASADPVISVGAAGLPFRWNSPPDCTGDLDRGSGLFRSDGRTLLDAESTAEGLHL